MTDLDESTLVKLAKEMAMEIRNQRDILASFGIKEEAYDEIEKNPFYIRAKEFYVLEWNSTASNADRIKFQAQAGTEQLMPHLIRRAMDPMTPLAAANETGKLIARMGGIGEVLAGDKPNAERFVITINLGADVDGKEVVEKYNKSIEIDANDINLGGSNGQTDNEIQKSPPQQLVRATR